MSQSTESDQEAKSERPAHGSEGSTSGGDARAGVVRGFDHVSLPMGNPEAMIEFYRALGLEVTGGQMGARVYVGNQMISFHGPEAWQKMSFLRAPAAVPPCGDLCFVWEGSTEVLLALLERVGAHVEDGPVERDGGRKTVGTSVYTRDPDGNLLEFMSYATQ
jgi:catechol 2,3-dioxygenase-like lactoylglutathione lyase family enzyme